VDAFSFMWTGTPVVVLNTGKSAERTRFDAAHELGHLVLHSEDRLPHGPGAEQEANAFAASLLMPRSTVIGQSLRDATTAHVLAAKKHWRVSAMAMTHRLSELGLVTEWGYRNLCVNLSRMGYRSAEPGGMARESSQLLVKVVRSLRREGTTPAQIAADLKITESELTTHIFGLVPLAVPGGAVKTYPAKPDLRIVGDDAAATPSSRKPRPHPAPRPSM
jgi:Zn-dependent peptidase ImmA (M78 family)